MIQTVNFNNFVDTFKSSDTYKYNFTYDGLRALFDYLEEYEESTDTKIEFDMVALCCDYTQENKISDIAEQYDECANMTRKEAREWLEDRTTLIEFAGGVIYQNF